jgi:catechol 2,3-dioxygenase-like lactoylglutathione lyase family enzyme
VIHHVAYEVRMLQPSARFYDAVFHALGARRLYESGEAIGWGVDQPVFWVTARALPKPGYGHVALRASGRAAVDAAYEAGLANGGTDDGPPGDRPEYGPTYYAGYMRDPGGLKVEVVAGA